MVRGNTQAMAVKVARKDELIKQLFFFFFFFNNYKIAIVCLVTMQP